MWRKLLIYRKIFEKLLLRSAYHFLTCEVLTVPIFWILIFFLSIVNVECGDGNFCYDETSCGPQNWGNTCSFGTMQSPINLESSKVTKITKSVSLVLNRDYAQPQTFYLMNTGTTVELLLKPDGTSPCMIKGNSFLRNEAYNFFQLHFHWGPNDFVGSEHQINGQSFPLELHLVHKQVRDNNKLAVLGIMFKIAEFDNPALSSIVNNLHNVRNVTSKPVSISSSFTINLKNLLPKKVKVFRYHGSLTTPPCTEGVIWTVFDDYVTISRNQLMEFRRLLGKNGRPIRTNFRPLQQAFTSKRKSIYYMKTFL